MSSESTDGAQVYKPSLAERAFRALGYRHIHAELPDTVMAELPGWIATEITLRFTFLDRVRLLFSGRLHLRAVTHTDVMVKRAKTATSITFLHPWGRGSR